MRILLATAEVSEVRWAGEMGILDGVLTTAATLFDREERRERDVLLEICELADAPVYATVHSVSGTEIYRDGRELARLSDQIVVQVPFIEDAVGAIRRLQLEGVRVAATMVFNAAQALLAARAGASSVVTPVDQLDAVGQSGADIVRELRAALDAAGAECDVVAVQPGDAVQFAACAQAGADLIAVTPATLRRLFVHPLTDRGLDQFLRDLSHQHAPWSSQ